VKSLHGRVALVTGAGRGIGRAHALLLAEHGAAVLVNDIDHEPAHEVATDIRRDGGRAQADVHDVASIELGSAAVQRAVDAFGRIDILVNNAGYAAGGGTIEHPVEAELDALYAVHVKAALGTMRAAIPHMRAQGYGRIVNTVSEVALDERFSSTPGYAMAKAALWSATLTAAAECAPYGITVNAISPGARTRLSAGAIRNDALDLDPVHVARVVAWLASPDAADVTGKVVHAAAGVWREYETRRHADTALVHRLTAELGSSMANYWP
jgi:NAD(P)-dependent dehydrogenase (short-subunit alcohol dehydrogenase family)